MEKQYVVTAINKLTGLRERISGPLAIGTALKKKAMLLKSPSRGRPYKYITVLPFPYEEEQLKFTNWGGGNNNPSSVVFLK